MNQINLPIPCHLIPQWIDDVITSRNFSGHSAFSWSPSLVYSTMLRPLCLRLKSRLRNSVWSTSFRGTNENQVRNAASSDSQFPRTSVARPWYQRSAPSFKRVWKITRVAVCFWLNWCMFDHRWQRSDFR